MGILNIFENEHNKNLSHLKNLILIANSDGKVEDSEWNLITEIAIKLGLTQNDMEFVLENINELKFIKPIYFKERNKQLMQIIALVCINGEINRGEIELCYKIGNKYGFDVNYINSIIALIISQVRMNTDFSIEKNIDLFLEIIDDIGNKNSKR